MTTMFNPATWSHATPFHSSEFSFPFL
jgi:hypothetical protein